MKFGFAGLLSGKGVGVRRKKDAQELRKRCAGVGKELRRSLGKVAHIFLELVVLIFLILRHN